MANEVAVVSPPQAKNDDVDILSDKQIDSLLLMAEARLLGSTIKQATENKDGDEAEEEVISLTTTTDTPSTSRPRIPGLNIKRSIQPYVHESKDIAAIDPSTSVPDSVKKLSESIRAVDQASAKKHKPKEKPHSGPQWFNLPKTVVTPELKKDLQILRMRSVLDAKRHYKKENGKAKPPPYSQIGTIVEGPTEFFSSRITNKDRKNTFVEEVLATEKENARFKRKYNEIQGAKTSGKKTHYKELMAKRARRN